MIAQLSNLMTSGLVGVAVASLAIAFLPAWYYLMSSLCRESLERINDYGLDDKWVKISIRFGGLMAIGILAAGALLNALLVAIVIVGLMAVAVPLMVGGYANRKSNQLRQQIAIAAEAVANASDAGVALPGAIAIAAKEVPKPMSNILSDMVAKHDFGIPVLDVFRSTKDRLKIDEFTLFSAAISVCEERGGDRPLTLRRIAKSLDEHQRLQRKIESDSAEGRKVIQVLGIFPIIFLIVFAFLYPSGTQLFLTSLAGQITLVGIMLGICGAIFWSRRIIDIG